MLEIETFLLAVALGCVGHVWVNVITSEGFLLNFIKRGIYSLGLPQWVKNPLIDCSICNTGQISLWTGLVLFGLSPTIIPFGAVAIATAYKLQQ